MKRLVLMMFVALMMPYSLTADDADAVLARINARLATLEDDNKARDERLAAIESRLAKLERPAEKIEPAALVTLYTAPFVCPPCEALKSYLDRRGVSYRTAVGGAESYPTLEHKGRYVYGYNPAAVDAMLQLTGDQSTRDAASARSSMTAVREWKGVYTAGSYAAGSEPYQASYIGWSSMTAIAEPARRRVGPLQSLGRAVFGKRRSQVIGYGYARRNYGGG